MDIKEKINKYFELKEELYKYFDFPNTSWRIFPLDDLTDFYWGLVDNRKVFYSDKPFTKELIEEGEGLWGGVIYTQRHLDHYIYRGEEYTMILVDTQCDFNILLMIFDNKKECKDERLIELFDEYW